MRYAYLPLVALYLTVLSGFPLAVDQESPNSDRWGPGEVHDEKTRTRYSVVDQPSVSADTPHHGLLSWKEGKTFGAIIPDFKVSDDTSGEDQGWASIATDADGDFVIAWHDLRNGDYDIYAQRYTSDGTPLDSNFKVNDDVSSEWQAYPCIAADGSGNFVIAWSDQRDGDFDIYAQRYATDGAPLDSNFKVNDDTLTARQWRPSIAGDGSGNFLISWEDSRDDTIPDIYAQRYASDGTPLDTNFKVNDDTLSVYQFWPAAAVHGSGDFVMTWVDRRNGDDDIYAQRFASNGTAIGGNLRVDDDTSSRSAWCPSITADAGGGFVIAWSDPRLTGFWDIYAQRCASDGTPIGDNFKVNDNFFPVSQAYPSIAADGSGNFIIAWQDGRNQWADVYAQRYASDGAPLDTNFRLTNTGYLMQWSPRVQLWNDRIYSAWTDHRAGGTEFDIWANVLDWNNPVEISDDQRHQIVSTVLLRQNCPNPFSPATSISYSIPRAVSVQLAIHDASGRSVRKWSSENQSAGEHRVLWDGRDEKGRLVGSGVYFYTLEVGADETVSKKMLLLR